MYCRLAIFEVFFYAPLIGKSSEDNRPIENRDFLVRVSAIIISIGVGKCKLSKIVSRGEYLF
jgi:hypothetical protein